MRPQTHGHNSIIFTDFHNFFAICVPGHHTAKRQKSAQDNYLLAYNFVLILNFFSLAYSAVNTFSQIYYKIFC